MNYLINNRNITILSLFAASVGLVTSIGWVLENRIIIEINYFSILFFFLLSLILMIVNGSILDDRFSLNLIIIFFVVPFIVSFGVLQLELFYKWIMVLAKTVSSIGILVVYSIRYYKKKTKYLLDNFKMFWIVLYCISELVGFIFKIYHWPYQKIIFNLSLLGYIPLLIVFYYEGIKNKYLLKRR